MYTRILQEAVDEVKKKKLLKRELILMLAYYTTVSRNMVDSLNVLSSKVMELLKNDPSLLSELIDLDANKGKNVGKVARLLDCNIKTAYDIVDAYYKKTGDSDG